MNRGKALKMAIALLEREAAAGTAGALDAALIFMADLTKIRAAKNARQLRWLHGTASKPPSVEASKQASKTVSKAEPPSALPLSDLPGNESPALLGESGLQLFPSQPSESARPNGLSRRGRASKGASKPGVSTAVAWEAYRRAYTERYEIAPAPSRSVNGQMALFCQKIPAADHAVTIEHYLRSNFRRYVEEGHSVGMLLAHAGKLRTEALTGRHGTAYAAQEADRRSGAGSEHAAEVARLQALEAAAEARRTAS